MSLLRLTPDNFPPIQEFQPDKLPWWFEVACRISACILEHGKEREGRQGKTELFWVYL